MKLLRNIYRWIFERGCVDYTKPYNETNFDSGFDKWNMTPVNPNTYNSTYDVYRTTAIHYPWGISSQYINSDGVICHDNSIGYHNSRL